MVFLDQVLEYIQKAQDGDLTARDYLVEKNLGLVWSIVKRFQNRGYDNEDLFQIGSIGLIKAIDKFDLSYDVKFSTYAVPMIMGEIKRFLRDDGMIKVSRSLKETAYKAKMTKEVLIRKLGREPSIQEIAQELQITIEELVMSLESGIEVESLYATIHQGDKNSILLIDKLDQNENQEKDLVDTITLKEIISRLKPRERQIIMMRYFNDKTQSEIASMIGISQVQVSRIEKKVLKEMKEMFG